MKLHLIHALGHHPTSHLVPGSSCRVLVLGFESLSAQALKRANKRHNFEGREVHLCL